MTIDILHTLFGKTGHTLEYSVRDAVAYLHWVSDSALIDGWNYSDLVTVTVKVNDADTFTGTIMISGTIMDCILQLAGIHHASTK